MEHIRSDKKRESMNCALSKSVEGNAVKDKNYQFQTRKRFVVKLMKNYEIHM